ncbi:MAG: anthranilate synthase component I [Melioribacteraceae bacterium]|nr:MAG: anthranilate synthase component I [Melioribacteraceae bacterium]
MTLESFERLASEYKIVPVFREITADLLTPVLAFSRLRVDARYPFLFESVESIGRLARYSFIGRNPHKVARGINNQTQILENGIENKSETDIFSFLKSEIARFNYPAVESLPSFTGGYVGYIGYETISLIEEVLTPSGKDELGVPDSIMSLYKDIVVFDHSKHKMIIVANMFIEDYKSTQEAYTKGLERVNGIKSELFRSEGNISEFGIEDPSDLTTEEQNLFYKSVESAKEKIYEGDIFQIVLSKRFSTNFSGDLLNVYRALRMINPSPYMYYLGYGDELSIVGTSPEDLLSVSNNKATILPIAGTRPRGKTDDEDIKYEKDLLSDPKEIAEHVMLVDLARNDLGRICDFNSIKVTENKNIHRFSHVMHIVSRVEGRLDHDKDVIDALKACFPAGTVSGAPKIRAMQLIDDYEQLKRNVYAGAVGYIDFRGNMDMCIAIRTIFASKNKLFWQAGAGIVADSKPENELQEIYNKSAVLVNSIKFAEVIDENNND